MNLRRLIVAAVAALAVPAFAQDATPPAPAAPPTSVLPGRPDAATAGGDALDPAFISTAGGISVRPPPGGKMIRRAGTGDELVRFVDDVNNWSMVVSRVLLSEPVPLAAPQDRATKGEGFADTMASQMPSDTPGKLLRTDLQPINGYDGALLASRYTEKGAKKLMQQAIVRRTDKSYYVVSYSTPLTQDQVETDPAATKAMDTFAKIVDSITLIDQQAIADDQNERLIRTRALMVNWTPEKLSSVLVPEQWLRLIRDGKDIGYTYIVEEEASDLPRVGHKEGSAGKASGVRIGIRSHTIPENGFAVDTESWMWVRFDRKQEAFRNLMVSTQKDQKSNFAVEIGTSVNRDRIIPVKVDEPGAPAPEIQKGRDERIELQIWGTSNKQQLPPLTREVPPYYMPQAIAQLLPRLVPLKEARTYLFASYVSETRQVMLRYVDVKSITNVTLGGKTYSAIPVQERPGYEGSITTHYMTVDGKYLGSVNEDNKITILVSDAASLRALWKDAKFERPADVDDSKK